MLLLHVFDFKINQHTEKQTLLQSFSGMFGMNVHFYYIVIVNNHNTVAYCFEISSQKLCVFTIVFFLYKKFRTVCEFDICFYASRGVGYNGSLNIGINFLVCNNPVSVDNALYALHYY